MISADIDKLESDWDGLKQFVMCKYSHQHMNISDTDEAHCEMYALDGNFYYEHVGACEHFKRITYFLDMWWW